jgi:cobyrinic acid a,c-diamide synthase
MACKKVLIAGTHSGVGKTSVSLGLMGALRNKSLDVRPFKVGPDYIDPGHHMQATGNVSRNLDSWMMDAEVVREIFCRSASGADISIIEGVMGLYDGVYGENEVGSSAHVAKILSCPVILVVDASSQSRSIAAVVKGFETLDVDVNLAGVIVNRLGSNRHTCSVKKAIESHTDLPVLGLLPRTDTINLPSRHLGLHTSLEDFKNVYGKMAEWAEDHLDLERIQDIANSAPTTPLPQSKIFVSSDNINPFRVGVACDMAFQFYYQDNFDLIECRGGEIIRFSPLNGDPLPENIDWLYLGGGYPEIYAKEISKNRKLLEQIKQFADNGGVILAECGGMMVLCEGITDMEGQFFPMAGVFPTRCRMEKKRQGLGYINIEFTRDTPFGKTGDKLRAHEFHYSCLEDDRTEKVFTITKEGDNKNKAGGMIYKNCLGTYAHLHFSVNPGIIPY